MQLYIFTKYDHPVNSQAQTHLQHRRNEPSRLQVVPRSYTRVQCTVHSTIHTVYAYMVHTRLYYQLTHRTHRSPFRPLPAGDASLCVLYVRRCQESCTHAVRIIMRLSLEGVALSTYMRALNRLWATGIGRKQSVSGEVRCIVLTRIWR